MARSLSAAMVLTAAGVPLRLLVRGCGVGRRGRVVSIGMLTTGVTALVRASGVTAGVRPAGCTRRVHGSRVTIRA
jgi:hypothetical protein